MDNRHTIMVAGEGDRPALQPGQVLLFEQYRLLRRTWLWVLLAAIVVTALVWYYVAEHVEPEYLATVEVVPPRKSTTPLDNLLGDAASGLKSLSISKIIGKTSSESGYTTYAILSSASVLDSLVERYDLYEVYDIPPTRPDLMLGVLGENIEYEVSDEGPIYVSVYDTDPERAASMANDIVRFANNLLWDLNRRETESITQFIAGRYSELQAQQSDLSRRLEDLMKRTNIYEPEAQLSASSSALIEARVNESTQRATLSMLERVLGPEDPQVQQQRALLQESIAERKRLESGGAGIGPSVEAMPQALMEYARLRQDYEVNAQLLALIEPMYEQTRFDQSRDIPQLIMLREADPPPVKARPRKGLAIASAFLGTLIAGYLLIALVAFFRSFSARYASYRELNRAEATETRGMIAEGRRNPETGTGE